jgi:hypothetical protein
MYVGVSCRVFNIPIIIIIINCEYLRVHMPAWYSIARSYNRRCLITIFLGNSTLSSPKKYLLYFHYPAVQRQSFKYLRFAAAMYIWKWLLRLKTWNAKIYFKIICTLKFEPGPRFQENQWHLMYSALLHNAACPLTPTPLKFRSMRVSAVLLASTNLTLCVLVRIEPLSLF